MPSMVKDLTPLQRMWLYENQRTLSEEGSSASLPEAEADRFARTAAGGGACGMDTSQHSQQQTTPHQKQKASIFRSRTANAATAPPPPSSSPSWNQHHNEPEGRHPPAGMMMPTTTTTTTTPMDEDRVGHPKRRRFSYDHLNPLQQHPQHTRPPPPYPYYEQQQQQQQQQHHHPLMPHPPPHYHYHGGYPPYENAGVESNSSNAMLLPPHHHQQQHYQQQQQHQYGNSRPDRRDDAPSPSGGLTTMERFPVFPHAGEKLTWQESFENLKAYKEHYGDCNVPQKYKGNTKLGGWVNKQRKKKRNPTKYGQLKPEHIKMLEDMNFKWE